MEISNIILDSLRRYNEEKKKEGLIPTVDMLIEDLTPKAPFVAGGEENDNEENEVDEDKLNDFRITEEDLT